MAGALDRDFIPVIDVDPLLSRAAARDEVVDAIAKGCETSGFFIITGHGVGPDLVFTMYRVTRDFFGIPTIVTSGHRFFS